MNLSDFRTPAGKRAVAGYLTLWGLSTAYLALRGADWGFPIIALVLFALGFGSLGWFLTRRADAPAVAVAAPHKQAALLLGYLVLYAFVLVG
ncbi:hypothetical protein [Novosphingobium sp.]|uniref:hypothetical protein n=1 Tax=Novosphingobium sp. TaxID=1874826 RepID=UPI0035AE3494